MMVVMVVMVVVAAAARIVVMVILDRHGRIACTGFRLGAHRLRPSLVIPEI